MGSSSLPVPRFPFPRCSCCTGTGAQLARLRAWQLTPALPAKPTLAGPLASHDPVRVLLALDDPRLADDCPPAAAAIAWLLGCGDNDMSLPRKLAQCTGAGLPLVLAEEALAKPLRGPLQWQLRLTCFYRVLRMACVLHWFAGIGCL